MSARWFITTALSPVRCQAGCSESLGAAAGLVLRGRKTSYGFCRCSLQHLSLVPPLTCHRGGSTQATLHCNLSCDVRGTGCGFGQLQKCPKLWFMSQIPLVLAVSWGIQQPPIQLQLILVLLLLSETLQKPVRVWFCHETWSLVLSSPQSARSQCRGLRVALPHCSTGDRCFFPPQKPLPNSVHFVCATAPKARAWSEGTHTWPKE